MAFSSLVKRGVQTANRLTSDLQVSIRWEPYAGIDSKSMPVFKSPSYLRGVLEEINEKRIDSQGRDVVSQARLIVLGDLDISDHDRMTLPDGTVPPIVGVVRQRGSTGVFYVSVYF